MVLKLSCSFSLTCAWDSCVFWCVESVWFVYDCFILFPWFMVVPIFSSLNGTFILRGRRYVLRLLKNVSVSVSLAGAWDFCVCWCLETVSFHFVFAVHVLPCFLLMGAFCYFSIVSTWRILCICYVPFFGLGGVRGAGWAGWGRAIMTFSPAYHVTLLNFTTQATCQPLFHATPSGFLMVCCWLSYVYVI